MTEGLDNFLTNIAQQNSAFEEKPKEKPATKKKPKKDDDFSMDSTALFEGVKPSNSILEQIGLSSYADDTDAFYDFPSTETEKNSSLTESQVRNIFREEMDRFFKEKQVITESNNPQIIYFKVGNSLFKGTMELVKNR